MKRRDFLHQATASFLLPVLLDGYGAKAFNRPSPFMQALMGAAGASDRVLVIVQMQGGNDGLNTIIPLDQMGVYTAANFRGNIAIPETKALKLKDRPDVGLHPAMTGFQQLYNAGKLSIVQGVSYPAPNFSHFRASDIWMTAVDSTQTVGSGWAGRYLDGQFPNFPENYPNATLSDPPAIQIGSVTSTSLLGPEGSMALVLRDPDAFARLVGDKPNDPGAELPNTYAGNQISFIRQQQTSSVAYAGQIKGAADKAKNLATYPTGNPLADQLKIIARLIAGGLQTRVYYVTLGGFDTHAAQVDAADTSTGTHANLLRTLSDAIAAFQADLTQLKLEDRVVGMTFSEFGRRALSNGSRGTDHGTSAPMFVFGTAVKTQVVGQNPNLSDLDRNNLKMQTDFRQVYAALLSDWFEADAASESATLFRNFAPVPVFKGAAVTGVEPTSSSDVLYPNPAATEVVLHSALIQSGVNSFQLSDLSGRNVLVRDFSTNGPALRLNVSNLSTGSYVLRVETLQGTLTRRLLVAR